MYSMINAKAETLHEKPAYRTLVKRHRKSLKPQLAVGKAYIWPRTRKRKNKTEDADRQRKTAKKARQPEI